MVKEILHNIWIWSYYSEEKGFNFNGTIVSDGTTKVLIDPVKLLLLLFFSLVIRVN